MAGITTFNGVVDANSTADFADTLTCSKSSGTSLAVTSDATIGGTLTVTGDTTFLNDTDASTSTDAGTIISGGCAIAKKINIGTDATIGGTLITPKIKIITSPTLPTSANSVTGDIIYVNNNLYIFTDSWNLFTITAVVP